MSIVFFFAALLMSCHVENDQKKFSPPAVIDSKCFLRVWSVILLISYDKFGKWLCASWERLLQSIAILCHFALCHVFFFFFFPLDRLLMFFKVWKWWSLIGIYRFVRVPVLRYIVLNWDTNQINSSWRWYPAFFFGVSANRTHSDKSGLSLQNVTMIQCRSAIRFRSQS